MDKVKEFIKKHKTEILVATGIIVVYQIGFRRGCKTSNRAVINLCDKVAKTMNITRF